MATMSPSEARDLQCELRERLIEAVDKETWVRWPKSGRVCCGGGKGWILVKDGTNDPSGYFVTIPLDGFGQIRIEGGNPHEIDQHADAILADHRDAAIWRKVGAARTDRIDEDEGGKG